MGSDQPGLEGTLGSAAMARTLGLFYIAGATLGALSLALPHSHTMKIAALAANITIAFAGGALLLLVATRLPAAAVPVFLAMGSVLITTAVYFDGHTGSVYAFFYVWVGVEAYYFLGRRLEAAQVMLAGALYGAALGVLPGDGLAGQRWLLTIGTALVAGLLVAYQRDRLHRLVKHLSAAG